MRKQSIQLILLISLLIINSLLYATSEKELYTVATFTNLSQNSEMNWISEGLADMLTTDLSKISKLNVVSRRDLKDILKEQALLLTGVFEDKDIDDKIGHLTGADYVISGSFSNINDEIRIDIRCNDVKTGQTIHSNSVTGLLDDFYSVEKKLVLKLIADWNWEISDNEQKQVKEKSTDELEAVKNNYLGVLAGDVGKNEMALNYFSRALEIDEQYSEAKINYDYFVKYKIKSKNNLIADMKSELLIKEDQSDKFIKILSEFYRNYIQIDILKLSPETILNSDKYKLHITFKISCDKNKIESFVHNLEKIVNGENSIILQFSDHTKYKYIRANLYPETTNKAYQHFLMKRANVDGRSNMFGSWYYFVFLDENGEVISFNLDNILMVYFLGKGKPYKNEFPDFSKAYFSLIDNPLDYIYGSGWNNQDEIANREFTLSIQVSKEIFERMSDIALKQITRDELMEMDLKYGDNYLKRNPIFDKKMIIKNHKLSSKETW